MPFYKVMILSLSYLPAKFFLSSSLPILDSTNSRTVFCAVMMASDMVLKWHVLGLRFDEVTLINSLDVVFLFQVLGIALSLGC